MSRKALSLLLLAILLAAAFLRIYLLPVLPPGLNFDEAGNGVAALDILRGQPHLWWQIGGGKEPLWPYLMALTTAMLGNIPLALRFPAAFVGVLTVAAIYPLTLVLFGGKNYQYREVRLISILSMAGVAFSAWHLHFSRLGFRAVLLPLLSTLAFYFFWHSIRGQKSNIKSQILAALFLSLAVYAYLAARLLLFVPALWVFLWWLSTKIRRQSTLENRHLYRTIVQFYVFVFLFLSPLIIYFIFNPTDFMARSGAVSIFNPAWNHGDLWGTVGRILTLTLGTFLGVTGDPNPLVNLPGKPALPLFLALFFVVGLIVSLYRVVRPSSSAPSPYLFLLSWWGVMLLPAILAPEGAPHHLRLIGTLVPTYIFVALGLAVVTNNLYHFLRQTRYARLAYLLPVACYLLLFLNTTYHYFVRWPALDFTLPFDRYAVRLADDIARAPAGTAYILPMDIRAGAEARHYTLDYLLAYFDSSYTYLPVDEQNAQSVLAQAIEGKNGLRVVRWTQDKHHEADAKEIVSYVLATNAQRVGQETFPVYDVEVYKVPNSADFRLPVIDQPINITLDDLMRIDVAYLPVVARPGQWLPVALTLAPLAQMDADYKASLRLTNSAGEIVAQKDRELLHTYHQGTSLWPPETVNEYYLLPVPPLADSGEYRVSVVIYHPDTQQPLTNNGVAESFIGTVQIK